MQNGAELVFVHWSLSCGGIIGEIFFSSFSTRPSIENFWGNIWLRPCHLVKLSPDSFLQEILSESVLKNLNFGLTDRIALHIAISILFIRPERGLYFYGYFFYRITRQTHGQLLHIH